VTPLTIIKLAGAAAATAVVAGAVAMGGTASAGPVSAARTTAHAAPAAHLTHPAALAATGAWGKAHLVPGLAALNLGHSAGVNQVSCASPGNCTAIGIYSGSRARHRATGAPGRRDRAPRRVPNAIAQCAR